MILANSQTEAMAYAAAKKLPRGRFRYAARAGTIKGLRMAAIHELPSFRLRADKHAINAALRFVRVPRTIVTADEWDHPAGRAAQTPAASLDPRVQNVAEAMRLAYIEADARAFIDALGGAHGQEAGEAKQGEGAAPAKATAPAPKPKGRKPRSDKPGATSGPALEQMDFAF